MKLLLMIAATVVAASAVSIASAAQVSPVSYSFDQPTSCGSFCYNNSATPSKLTDGLVGVAGWADQRRRRVGRLELQAARQYRFQFWHYQVDFVGNDRIDTGQSRRRRVAVLWYLFVVRRL